MKPLFDADYAAIEARIVCWLAGQEDALDEYRQGIDRYKVMASQIYNVPVEEVNKHPQRFIGKQTILGCGFMQGPTKFRKTCEKFGYKTMPVGVENTAVELFRQKHPRIKSYWFDVESAAHRAVMRKGEMVRVSNRKTGDYKVPVFFLHAETAGMPFLLCKLPSGRKLAYPKPKLVPSPKFEGKTVIQFFGKIGMTVNWGNCDTYGGKLVENCLAGNTQVFSSKRGWVRLDSVTSSETLWDGECFVKHGGLARKGAQKVINCHGVEATPEHLFLSQERWISAEIACTMPIERLSSINEISFLSPPRSSSGLGWGHLWQFICTGKSHWGWQENPMDLPMRLWEDMQKSWFRITTAKNCWVWVCLPNNQSSNWGCQFYTQYEPSPRILGLAEYAGKVFKSKTPSMEKLWRKGDNCLRKLATKLSKLLGRHGAKLSTWFGYRPSEQQRQLLQRKLQVDTPSEKHTQQTKHISTIGGTPRFLGCGFTERNQTEHPLLSDKSRSNLGTNTINSGDTIKQVFDIINCGPRNRFAVKTPSGRIIIAHNCTQAVAADIMCQGAHNAENAGFGVMALIHDQALAYKAPGQTADRFTKLLTDMPVWADGLPIEAEGAEVPFYKKD